MTGRLRDPVASPLEGRGRDDETQTGLRRTPAPEVSATEPPAPDEACPECGGPIQRRRTGRPARFCSKSCRQSWHRGVARAADARSRLAGLRVRAEADGVAIAPLVQQVLDVAGWADHQAGMQLYGLLRELHAHVRALDAWAREYHQAAATAAGYPPPGGASEQAAPAGGSTR